MEISAGLLVFFVICFCLYRGFWATYLDPLTRIPKIHPLCAISNRWGRGLNKNLEKLREYHAGHGPTIRTGPREISITDLRAIRIVYGQNGDKDAWYIAGFTNFGGQNNLVSLLDRESHRVRRRLLAGVYANTTITDSSGMMNLLNETIFNRMRRLCYQLADRAEDINVLKLAQ